MVLLDFDGLDGSLVVPSWSHTPTNRYASQDGQAITGETAALGFTEPVDGAIEDINPDHTEPLKTSVDEYSTAHTEPVSGTIDDFETGDQGPAESAADRAAGTQALQASSARLAAVRLRELGGDARKSHPIIPTLNNQGAPELITNKDKVSIDKTQPGHRHTLPGIIVAFLAGIIIGGGILYFWTNDGLWLSEPPLNVADSLSQPKPQTESVTLPSTSKAVVRHESDSIARSTPADDLALNLPSPSAREGKHGMPSLNSTSNGPIYTELPTQSARGIENHTTAVKEIDTLGQQNMDSTPKPDIQLKSWTIPFTFNKFNTDPEIVNDLLPEIKQCEEILDIVGHTCTLGDEEKNLFVGLARADFVRDQLVKLGISSSRLIVSSAGGDRPVATNSTKEGRVMNRRVVIHCRPH
jgi:outer membrane protein OmpA-like peptidoglycan-associated protein